MADLGKAFVAHYYNTIVTNRAALASLYAAESMLTFEGQEFAGPAAIMGKLGALPAEIAYVGAPTLEVQPSPGPAGTGVIVFVTGKIQIGGPNALQFTEVFQVMAKGGQHYIHNQMMRLVYG